MAAIPYQVALKLTYDFNDVKLCGGTIISPILILTAAHCVQALANRPHKVEISAGSSRTAVFFKDTQPIQPNEQIRQAFRIYVHEDYVRRRAGRSVYMNDIALIVLGTRLEFNAYVNKIPLPSEDEEFLGKATVSGWGQLTEGGKIPYRRLQFLVLKTMTNQRCQRVYPHVTSEMLCAASKQGVVSGICHGDSGGPLVCKQKKDRQLVLCGVVSHAKGCARQGYPSVFTRVSKYVGWIKKSFDHFRSLNIRSRIVEGHHIYNGNQWNFDTNSDFSQRTANDQANSQEYYEESDESSPVSGRNNGYSYEYEDYMGKSSNNLQNAVIPQDDDTYNSWQDQDYANEDDNNYQWDGNQRSIDVGNNDDDDEQQWNPNTYNGAIQERAGWNSPNSDSVGTTSISAWDDFITNGYNNYNSQQRNANVGGFNGDQYNTMQTTSYDDNAGDDYNSDGYSYSRDPWSSIVQTNENNMRESNMYEDNDNAWNGNFQRSWDPYDQY